MDMPKIMLAGFGGYCHKFDFICHDMRSCQAWEEREFDLD